MSGTIDVKDFKITAGIPSPSQVKISKVKAKKKLWLLNIRNQARLRNMKFSTH